MNRLGNGEGSGVPRLLGVGLLTSDHDIRREGAVSVPKRCPEEFRRKVLDLVAAGRPIA